MNNVFLEKPLPKGLLWLFVASLFLMQFAHVRAAQSVLLTVTAVWFGLGFLPSFNWRQLPSDVRVAMGAWVAIASLSCLWSALPTASLDALFTNLLLPFVFFMMAAAVGQSRDSTKPVAFAVLAGLGVGVVAALYAAATGRVDVLSVGKAVDLGSHPIMRWYPGPGLFSTSVVIALPVLYLLAMDKILPRRFALIAMLAVAIGGACTLNRMFWPVIGVAVAVIGLVEASRFFSLKRWQAVAIAVIAIAGCLALVVITAAAKYRGTVTLNDAIFELHALSRDGRFGIWQTWFSAAKEHFLLGAGFGKDAPRAAYSDQLNAAIANGVQIVARNHPHNYLISIWVQTGLVGLSIYIYLTIAFARLAFRVRGFSGDLRRTSDAMLALMLVFLLKNATDDFYDRTIAVLYWTYLGLLIGRALGRMPRTGMVLESS